MILGHIDLTIQSTVSTRSWVSCPFGHANIMRWAAWADSHRERSPESEEEAAEASRCPEQEAPAWHSATVVPVMEPSLTKPAAARWSARARHQRSGRRS